MKEILNKIRNLIKLGRITNPGDDSGLDAVSQCEYMGKVTNAAMFLPYGISAKAPNDSLLLIFSAGGSSQNSAAIPLSAENRFRDLKDGELKIGNLVSKCFIHFKENGAIQIKAGTGDAVVDINENGEIAINGGTEKVVKGDTFQGSFEAHTHSTAFGPSGAPLPPYNPLPPGNFNDTIKV